MPIPEGLLLDHSGGAVLTTLIADIGDATSSISVLDGNSYPQAANGKYTAIRIDAGKNNEEVIWYTNRVGNTFQQCLRGQDGTAAYAHGAGATVEHVFTALEAHQANVHYATTDPNFVPHTQLVHKTQAQTISGNHTHTGTSTFSGPFVSTGAATFDDIVADTIDINIIAGPTAFNNTITYADTAGDPKTITPTSVAAKGTSRAPAASDVQFALDVKAFYRVMHPAGEVIEWPYATLPQHIAGNDGLAAGEWKWADGSTVSATAYPAYAAVAGTTHGGTAQNPALPNRMNGRVPVGVDGAHGLAATGGATTKTLSVSEMPSHNHAINDPTHNHQSPSVNNFVEGTASTIGLVPTSTNQAAFTGSATRTSATGITIQNTGGGQAFNIEQPWVGTKYICKVH